MLFQTFVIHNCPILLKLIFTIHTLYDKSIQNLVKLKVWVKSITGNSRTLATCSSKASETSRQSLPGSLSTETESLKNLQKPLNLSNWVSVCWIDLSFLFSDGYLDLPVRLDLVLAHRIRGFWWWMNGRILGEIGNWVFVKEKLGEHNSFVEADNMSGIFGNLEWEERNGGDKEGFSDFMNISHDTTNWMAIETSHLTSLGVLRVKLISSINCFRKKNRTWTFNYTT